MATSTLSIVGPASGIPSSGTGKELELHILNDTSGSLTVNLDVGLTRWEPEGTSVQVPAGRFTSARFRLGGRIDNPSFVDTLYQVTPWV